MGMALGLRVGVGALFSALARDADAHQFKLATSTIVRLRISRARSMESVLNSSGTRCSSHDRSGGYRSHSGGIMMRAF